MHKKHALALLIPLLAAAAGCSAHKASIADAGKNEWITLWDGGDLSGWKQAGPGEFVVEGGALRATGGMGLLWYAQQDFANFILRLEWQVADAGDNSGVFVRFPDPGDDPWVAVNEGYEIQICDTAEPQHNTGSVYSFQEASAIPTKPAGAWNLLEITGVGQHYIVKVNGKTVNRFTGDRNARGYVGLQNHDDDSPVRFRNIRARTF